MFLATRNAVVADDGEGEDMAEFVARAMEYEREVAGELLSPQQRRVLLQYNPKNAKRGATASKTVGMAFDACIQLSYGCRVMLQRNLATPLGAVNGALGTVVGFVYFLDRRPTPEQLVATLDEASVRVPPLPVVLVRLDRFKGRSCMPQLAGGERIVPICAIECKIRVNGQSYVRLQLPLRVAKATTVHKAQGQSLDSVCLDGRRMFTRALAYVGISRARFYSRLTLLHVNLSIKAFQFTAVVAVEREYARLRRLPREATSAAVSTPHAAAAVTAAVAAVAPAPVQPPSALMPPPRGQDMSTAPLFAGPSNVALTEWHGLERRQLGEVHGLERRQLGEVHGLERQHARERRSSASRRRGERDCGQWPTVVLPADASLLRDVRDMSTMAIATLLNGRKHSPVYMPLICAAVARAHAKIVLVSTLMGQPRWNRIVLAIRAVLPAAVEELPWGVDGEGQPYLEDVDQEGLLHAMVAEDHTELQLFCASLP